MYLIRAILFPNQCKNNIAIFEYLEDKVDNNSEQINLNTVLVNIYNLY